MKCALKVLAVVNITLALLVVVGCDTEEQRIAARNRAAQEVSDKADELYTTYLKADARTAKKCMEAMVDLFEHSDLSPDPRAEALCRAYARLYAIEKRTNGPNADAYLIYTQYWDLKYRHNTDVKTPEEIISFIDQWDKNRSDDRNGPAYLKSLRAPTSSR